jgi:hypothetical protein
MHIGYPIFVAMVLPMAEGLQPFTTELFLYFRFPTLTYLE